MNEKSLIIHSQPDNTSCGATCLHAIYNYYGDTISLEQVVKEVEQFEDGGGTFSVVLANHALKRGYKATMYVYNLNLFDPSWFRGKRDIGEKLRQQIALKKVNKKFTLATQAYVEYIELGGELRFEDLNASLLRTYLSQGVPMLAGLSSTYLYRSKREDPIKNVSDEMGEPCGHFVVLHGIHSDNKRILIADPYVPNPVANVHYYSVPFARLICSIMLGVWTYDGNLLVIEPKDQGHLPGTK